MTLGVAPLTGTQAVSVVLFLQTVLHGAHVCMSLCYYFLSLLSRSELTVLIKWSMNQIFRFICKLQHSSLLLALWVLASFSELATTSRFSRKIELKIESLKTLFFISLIKVEQWVQK